jgi:hypothetical protein
VRPAAALYCPPSQLSLSVGRHGATSRVGWTHSLLGGLEALRSTSLVRIGGLALVAGGILFVVHIVLRSAVTAGPSPVDFAKAGSWVPINVLGALGAVLVLLGLPALYPRMVGSGGPASLIGVALVAASWMLVGLFLSLYGVLVLPWLAGEAPSLVAVGAPPPAAFVITFVVGLLAWVVGACLIAIPFVRGRDKPGWVGYVLLASAGWMVIGNLVIAPSGPESNLGLNLLSNMGPVLFLIAVGVLGYQLWSGHSPSEDPLAPSA